LIILSSLSLIGRSIAELMDLKSGCARTIRPSGETGGMKKSAVVDIRSGGVARCSRRILHAFESENLQTLEKEIADAAKICQRVPDSSLGVEQVELLEALLESMHRSRHQPSLKTEISLLGHLAGRN